MTADLTLVVMGGLDAGVLQEIGPDTPVVVLTGPIEELRKLAGLLGTTVRVGPILPGGVAIDLDAIRQRLANLRAFGFGSPMADDIAAMADEIARLREEITELAAKDDTSMWVDGDDGGVG